MTIHEITTYIKKVIRAIRNSVLKIYKPISGLFWFILGGVFTTIYLNDSTIDKVCCQDEVIVYKGKLVDSLNIPIINAKIAVQGLDYVTTNEFGYFKFDSLPIKANNFFEKLPWILRKKCPSVESNIMSTFKISFKDSKIPMITKPIPYSQLDTNRVVIP